MLRPSRFVVILDGFLFFIFASIKLSTPLIQAHFAESFRPVALGL